MKQKISSMLLIASFLSIFMSIAFVSAADFTLTASTPSDLTKLKTNTSFLITPTVQSGQTVNMVVTIPQLIDDGDGHTITLNPPYILNFNNVANGQANTVPISYVSVPSNFPVGKYSFNVQINATDSANSTNTLTKTVPVNFINDFCSNGENNTDLSISEVEIVNNDGDEDTEWKALDTIDIRVEVTNDGSESLKSIYVELGLFDSSGKNVVNTLDNLDNKKIKIGTISDGKSITKEFKFTVPVDFKDEDYNLVVKAYSETSGGQKVTCTAHSSDLDNDYYQVISGIVETDEDKQVILNNIVLSSDTAQCGGKNTISGDIVNVGDTDYSDKIKVTLYNTELKINELEEINEDLDTGDSSSFSIDFTIPQNATEKSYTLNMRTYYDYDDDDGSYGLSSDKVFTKTITVSGNCLSSPTTPSVKAPTITAELDPETPEAIAGKQVIVKATIKNNDVKTATYSVTVQGNSAWSTLTSIDPSTLTIPAGQSQDVIISLKTNNDAYGDKDLTIKANYGENNQLVTQQVVTVSVVKANNGFDSISQNLRDNWFIYVIVIINIILIIAIIVVIVKMVSRPPRRAREI